MQILHEYTTLKGIKERTKKQKSTKKLKKTPEYKEETTEIKLSLSLSLSLCL